MVTSLELCAGAGGQALGLEMAGFEHVALVEIDSTCRATLTLNRPRWNVLEADQSDLQSLDPAAYCGVDLIAGGLPCPPFSVAGRQLGQDDERNLFPDALRVVDVVRPKAVLIENVRGFLDPTFADYRARLSDDFRKLGYELRIRLLNASDFGVPQLRPRVALVALQDGIKDRFDWPAPNRSNLRTVGATLIDLMKANEWRGADTWARRADRVAPTIVGGSKKHGGPDLGPTRARRAWAELGVEGRTIADSAPDQDFVGMPRLTVRMVARLQGFPDTWAFSGRKTSSYRQVGNAFPPPLAAALGRSIAAAIGMKTQPLAEAV